MVRNHSDTQRDKHFVGRSLEETIVIQLNAMLERNKLDEDFEVVGKARGRINSDLLFNAVLLPGASIPMKLRPDFGLRHKATGQFSAFGGAKNSLRERGIQDLVIAQLVKAVHPGSFWFECTVAENDQQSAEQIQQMMDRRMAIYGNAWDAFCSTSVPDSMRVMKNKLATHLKTWRPEIA